MIKSASVGLGSQFKELAKLNQRKVKIQYYYSHDMIFYCNKKTNSHFNNLLYY